MPSARSATGSSAQRQDAGLGLGGHLATRHVDHPAHGVEVQDRHDAGDDREVHAQRPRPLDEADVVADPQHHLGDRELRAGVVLRLQRERVVVEGLGVTVALGEGRDTHRQVGGLLDEGDQLGRVGDAALGRHPRRAGPLGRVAAQREHIAYAGILELGEDARELVGGVADARQVRHREHRGLARDPLGDGHGALAGAAAGAVRHGDEGRVEVLELTDRAPQDLLTLVVLRAGRTRTRTTARPRGRGRRCCGSGCCS